VLVIFSLGIFVASVGVDQGRSPFQCIVYNPMNSSGLAVPDGRACEMSERDGAPHDGVFDCMAAGHVGLTYSCERVGLFGTTSVGGRVRYRGLLLDPNDLALATALAVPFSFAFVQMRRSVLRVALLVATLVVVLVEIVFTQSRGGQITIGCVLGAYFVKR